MARMTEHQEPASPDDTTVSEPRQLRRRVADRVIGGVAGGIADYLNIDPLLVRASLVGLMIFGGAGLVLYVVAWLLIPVDGRDASIVQDWFAWLSRRIGRRTAVLGLVFMAVVAIWVLGESQPCLVYLDDPYTGECIDMGYGWLSGFELVGMRNTALVAIAVIFIGFVVVRWRDGSSRAPGSAVGPMPSDTARLGTAPVLGGATEAAPVPAMSPQVVAAPVRRPRSPLEWYVLAAVLVSIGLLAIVANMPDQRVGPGQYFGAGLGALGIGLVVGAWWGRARPLIALGVLVLPFAVTAALINVPIEGGYGEQMFHPQAVGELRPAYRLAAGEIFLDLTDLDSSEPVVLEASVGVGRLIVIVPQDARLTIDARVSGGRLSLFGGRQVGTGLADRIDRSTGAGTLITLTLATGIGEVLVTSPEGK
jgi:phage shock protein PspC (stress-responsive transcriptional regulator)